MNFESQAQSIASTVERARADLKALDGQLKRAAKKTEELLAIASEVGVTAVSIGKVHPLVGNESWPFAASGSIFTPTKNEHRGWPAAWHIAEAAGVSHGCGNSGQHNADTSNLIDGVYECRAGVWTRIDLEPEA